MHSQTILLFPNTSLFFLFDFLGRETVQLYNMEAQKDKEWIARKNKRNCIISDYQPKLELRLGLPNHESKPKYLNLPFSSERIVQQAFLTQWPCESAPSCSLKRFVSLLNLYIYKEKVYFLNNPNDSRGFTSSCLEMLTNSILFIIRTLINSYKSCLLLFIIYFSIEIALFLGCTNQSQERNKYLWMKCISKHFLLQMINFNSFLF